MPAFTRLAWAVESTFAMTSATTGRPDFTGVSYADAEVEGIELTIEEVKAERDTTRNQPAATPDAVGEHDNGSNKLPLRRGSIKITLDMANVGAAGGVESTLAFALWNTLLNDEGAPPAASDAATGEAATQLTATTAASYEAGLLFSYLEAGQYRSARVVGDTADPFISYSPGSDSDIGEQTVRFMRQLYIASAWSTKTITVRVDGRGDGTAGMREYLGGLKVSEVEYKVDDTGRELVVFTCQIAHAQADHSNYSLASNFTPVATHEVVSTNNTAGGVTDEWFGKGGTMATGVGADRLAVDYELWTFKLTVPLSPITCRGNAIGQGGWRVGSATTEVMLPMCETGVSGFGSDRSNQARRILMLDAGPFGQGKGHTICLASAFLSADPTIYERGEEVWTQKLMFGAGPNCQTDDPTVGPSASVNAWLIVGWPL